MPDDRSGVARHVYQAERQTPANKIAIGTTIVAASSVAIPPETLMSKTSRPARGIHTARYAAKYDRRVRSGCMAEF
jgi:hypothetical protein